jgi:hypothetical protein
MTHPKEMLIRLEGQGWHPTTKIYENEEDPNSFEELTLVHAGH